jgi:hypothetical protein
MRNPTGAGEQESSKARGIFSGCFWWGVLLFAGASFPVHLEAQQQQGSSEEFLNRLEWRGVLALPGEVRISLHDKAGQGGFWVGLGEIRAGVEVVEYDPKENQVTLRHGEATRTLTMSSSSVLALAEQSPAHQPPQVPAAPNPAEPFDESTRERLTQLWQQAMAGSFDLQEIDYSFRALNRERENLAETIAMTPPENPDLAAFIERQNELSQEERRLTEGALAELQKSPNLSGQAGQELNAGLRAGLLSQLPAPPVVEETSQTESGDSSPDQP